MAVDDKTRFQSGLLKEMIQFRDSNYLKHLRDGLAKTTSEMLNAKDEIDLRWKQAEARLLSRLIAEIEGAREALVKLEHRPQSTPKQYPA